MLFRNIGKKIKLLTKLIFWVGVAISVIAAIVLFVLALLPQYLPLSQEFATAGIKLSDRRSDRNVGILRIFIRIR